MRVAVIGCGSIGSRHIRNLIALGVPPENIWASDTRAACFATLPAGVYPAHDGQEIEADALLICTPAQTHKWYVKRAIAARLPFLVEKPAVLSTADLTESEWQTDVPNLVACNMRWHGAIRTIREALPALGTVLMAEWYSRHQASQWPGTIYANAIWEVGAHEFDLAVALLGPADVLSACVYYGHDVLVVLQHAGGARSRLEFTLHHSDSGPVRGAWFYGTRHAASWKWGSPLAWRSGQEVALCAVGEAREACTRRLADQMYVAELEHFLAVVRGEETSVNPLLVARHVIELCEETERKVLAA